MIKFLTIILLTLTSSLCIASDYDRSHFGVWSDLDGDCQNTRAEILIAQSQSTVTFSNPSFCKVVTGKWYSLFTGQEHQLASELHIDHIVPLAWAWTHGASSWTSEDLIKFGNDMNNLIPVEPSLNMEKGALGPDKWLPPTNKCEYFFRFEVLRKAYMLELTNWEQESFKVIQDVCSAEN
jgi:hypothetical protein